MSDANWLWPIDGKSFYDINNNNYLVHIDWSKNSKEDYQKLSQDFFECGYKICEKIVDSGHDNIKSDMWFFPTMYLFRHGMELGLKALICGAISEKRKIQQIFLDCKNDRKDPKVIAKLVTEGRYSAPYTPDGVYADLRIMVANCKRLIREMTQIKNRFASWFAIYFPEYTDVFGDYEAQSSMLLLKKVCTPEAIVELGAEKINQIWRDAKLRAVGMKRATTLCETAKRSIGLKKGSSAARYEMKPLLEDYEYKKAQLDAVMEEIEKLCRKIPESEQMLAIKGIGVITVAGFLAEVGDVRRFESPRQIQKLAGLSLRENSSGKHKGQTTISKRGRSKLRAVLFNAAIPLIAKNPEFKSLHEYYTTRANNPLKKKQSVIAISCKLIRVFYTILANGVTYDPQKMLSDIHRQPQVA